MRVQQNRPGRHSAGPQIMHMGILGMAQQRRVRGMAEILGIVGTGMRAVQHQWHALRLGAFDGQNAGDVQAHSVPPSCRWQATDRPASLRKTGTSRLQRGPAIGQRGWKWQPGGGARGEGISPLIVR